MDFLARAFSIKGRFNRKKYIMANLFILLAMTGFALVAYLMINPEIFLVCMVPIFLYSLASTIKRLHDLNLPTWTSFIVCFVSFTAKTSDFFAIVSILMIIFLLCKKGTNGNNKYGENPLSEINHDIRATTQKDESSNRIAEAENKDVVK